MADPYGTSAYGDSATWSKPPSWADWDRDRRDRWRGKNPRPDGGNGIVAPGNPMPPTAPPPTYPGIPGGNPTTGSPWVPGFGYGGDGGLLGRPLEGTPLGNSYFNDPRNFASAYDLATSGSGLSPEGAYSSYVRQMQPYVERALAAARTQNPSLDTMGFLRNYLGDLRTRYQSLPAAQLRGENPRLWGQGALNVIGR